VTRLFLVRHAAVELREDVPPSEWELTPAGRAAAARLRAELPAVEWAASSPEPKALGTAEALGFPVRLEPDLREVERPAGPILAREEWVALVGRYLDGEAIDGWEPADAARARFAATMSRLLDDAGKALVVVTHGTVASLWLGLSVGEWERIGLPAVAEIDPATRRLLRRFSAPRPPGG
jgi:broad specificity phosphatase PhoE